MRNFEQDTKQMIAALTAEADATGCVTRTTIRKVAKDGNLPEPLWMYKTYKRGSVYRVPTFDETVADGVGYKRRGRPRKDNDVDVATKAEQTAASDPSNDQQ